MSGDDERLRELSDEAFALAKGFANSSLGEADRQRAVALGEELQGLKNVVKAASGHEREGLEVAYSEAWVDLDWVLSEGRTPTSIRMAMYHSGNG